MRRKYFRLKKIALGLALAAVLVPTAQAKPVPANPVGHKPIASKISVQSPVFVPSRHLPQADIQAINAPTSNGVVTSTRHAALSSIPVPAVQKAQADTFSWSDAGVGASVAFGASLLLLMAVALGRRRSGSGPAGLARA